MAESVRAAAAATDELHDPRTLRVALSPFLFRGMMVGMAAVAVAIHRATGSQAMAWGFAKGRARTLERLLGVRVRLIGLEHLERGRAYVFTPNHQSHLDILTLLGHLPGATRFAAKRSLWRHAVVAAVLDALGMVPIDRESSTQAQDALNHVTADGQSFVIFPEGTRSRDGRLRDFKKGAFVLAIRLGLPVVPVICRGTRRLMPRGSRLNVVPGEIEIVIAPPIPTTGLGFDDRDALAARVRAAIEEHHTGV
ncbi:MAG TPA: lysophospholipid acyltransferase family protein [Candidatus Binatia bacterium]|jgi:1-acyl-sn-glycerol-3-phosphate acyltransferase|nr:lysophospholipid acyltransferase family protein [Candidatus Binatia bacterium]